MKICDMEGGRRGGGLVDEVFDMKTFGDSCIVLTALACIAALGISIYPGVLNTLLFFAFMFSIVIVPIVTIAAVVVLVVLYRKGKLQTVQVPWKQVGILFLLLGVTFVLLLFYVPRRIAFAVSRSSFEELLNQAPKSEFDGLPLDQRVGLFKVDEYAADPRGGVYIRVHLGPDGIGPDRTSYGFVFEPNREGTPFGASSYHIFNLGDGWYWFRASDDFY